MANISECKRIAISFEDVIEQPHFEKTAFTVKKKIFATLDEAKGNIVVKLSAVDQSVFCAVDPSIIYPVAGSWGTKGWTVVLLKKIKRGMLKELLTASYCAVAPTKLAKKYQYNDQSN